MHKVPLAIALVLLFSGAATAESQDVLPTHVESIEAQLASSMFTQGLVWLDSDQEFRPEMVLRAAVIQGTVREEQQDYATVPIPGHEALPPSPSQEYGEPVHTETPVDARDVELAIAEIGNFIRVGIVAHDSTTVDISSEKPRFVHGVEPAFCGEALVTNQIQCADAGGSGYVQTESATLGAPGVVGRGGAGHHSLVARGDFTIQIMGVDLSGSGLEMRGTTERQEGPTDATYREVIRIISLEVFDGEIQLALDGFAGEFSWASQQMVAEPTGRVTFGLDSSGESEDLNLNDVQQFVITPGDQDLVLRSAEAASGNMMASVASAVAKPPGLAAIAVGTGLVAFLIFIARFRRPAHMSAVEDKLAAGKYRPAARLARRAVRADPANENAVVARAVALSKSGRARRVIREVTAHLSRHKVTDGVLHYILGLAYLDSEDGDEAFVHLKEAARLTPSLRMDVDQRLGRTRSAAAGGYA